MGTRGSDRGAALVEAAFIIPMLIMLVFGVIDVSRAFFDAAKVQEAAQEGAVYAALNPTEPADAIARAEETIQDIDFTGSVTVTCPTADQVTVTAFGPVVNLAARLEGMTKIIRAPILLDDPRGK